MASRTRFSVRVTPRGGADRIEGVGASGELRVRVRVPAADGAANAAVLRLLADELHVALSLVRLERGAAARLKRVAVEGLDPAAVAHRWPGLLTS